jgi:hypothetical protein
MEADWEIEIGPDAPVINAIWPGFVDLRRTPERIREIEEARSYSALADALLQLNSHNSQSWTSKCDLWTPDPRVNPWDPDEMNATPAESAAARACYIDLLPLDASVFAEFDEAETWARTAVQRLREIDVRCCRADLVIRRAFQGDLEGIGITAYVTACGAASKSADIALCGALMALGNAINTTTNLASKIVGAVQ